MKVQEIESLIENIKSIKDITDKQEYKVSSAVNQLFVKILPILNKELERVNTDFHIETNCPKIRLLHTDDCEKVNEYMESLVKNDYKIIDFGFINNDLAYVKFTN